ncbi:ABC transporter permease [Clostridium felsineum]|uniref:Uncharacterized protein n=1 Tax=Clostridium felsineum TaxID=36839 RepID=A0A1S8LZK2_9CLOT|nr:hypothetical protein [Clostridium felsineum]URZ08726.1 hypothetical protein CLROS_041200 [Clostridium felsineum]URZ09354.1 hypothetical protein CROST_000250 [Clostridium felsineum]
MKRLIHSELYRMLHSTKIIAIVVITILIFMLDALFIKMYHFGFYNPKHTVVLNNLNFSPFILRDTDFFIFLIFCPIVFCDSLNYESTSGMYRLIMIRGYSKAKCILSKVASCAIVCFILTILMFIVGVIFGFMFENSVRVTSFFNGQHLNSTQALLYDFKFYIINYLLILMFLGICAVISVLSPQVVIAYIICCAVWLIMSPLANLVVSSLKLDIFDTKIVFDVLDGRNTIFWLIALCMTLGLFTLSSLIFKKKDYLY